MEIMIRVELDRVSGPNQSKDLVGEAVQEMIDGDVYVEGPASSSQFEIVNVEVQS